MRDWSWRDTPRFVRFMKQCSPDAVLRAGGRRAAANVPHVKSGVEHAAEIENLYERVLSGNPGG